MTFSKRRTCLPGLVAKFSACHPIWRLTPEQLSSFRDIVQTHELFAKAPIVHAQMAEFYKAAVSHIELLQSINEKVLESSGITKPR